MCFHMPQAVLHQRNQVKGRIVDSSEFHSNRKPDMLSSAIDYIFSFVSHLKTLPLLTSLRNFLANFLEKVGVGWSQMLKNSFHEEEIISVPCWNSWP